MNLLIIFLTGLTTGGVSCAAMQGGLLASIIANQKAKTPRQGGTSLAGFDKLDYLPILSFLLAKLASHTILGFLLGLVGSVLTLSLGMKLAFQGFAALFMFATAMNLLDAHPIFRHLSFQPPKFLYKYLKKNSQNQAMFAPAILGLFTVFIPCGVTQAMEVLAISSGNPITGALVMASFVLGTSPVFALIGLATARFSEILKDKFLKIAAILLILMAIYSLNGVLLVLNSPLTLNKLWQPMAYFFSDDRFSQNSYVGQKITININNRGYEPKYFQVKQNQEVELTLVTKDTYSCATSFVFSKFGIRAQLTANDKQTFKFTPQEKGKFTFSCSMGMYSGMMEVI